MKNSISNKQETIQVKSNIFYIIQFTRDILKNDKYYILETCHMLSLHDQSLLSIVVFTYSQSQPKSIFYNGFISTIYLL